MKTISVRSILRAVSLALGIGGATLAGGCIGDPQEDADVDLGEAPTAQPQDRGSLSNPDNLCIVLGNDANAGTTTAVTLTWINDSETWRCDVNPTTANHTYCCVPSYQGYSGATGYFGIYNPSGDGIQIESAYSLVSGSSPFWVNYFTEVVKNSCSNYATSQLAYKKCWVDQSGNGSCGHMKIGANPISGLWEAHSFSCD